MNKFNQSGCYDPTPYQTITNIIKEEKSDQKSAFRPLVYVSSPFSGDVDANIKKAQEFCRFALDNGQIPIAPHLLFPQFMNDDDPNERQF